MTLVWVLKFAAWFVSFFGLCAVFNKLIKARFEFMPLITAAAVSCTVMAFGMLGAMHEAAVCIYALGFLSAAYCALEAIRKRVRPSFGFLASVTFITAWAAFAAYILRDTFIYIYDDLSHWALVAREMLFTDALPDANMKTLVFQAYPTGSACFIYYFCRFTGSEECMFTLSQSLFKGFGILPLFAFIRKNRAFGIATVVIAFAAMLLPDKFLMTLQVDSLLAFVSVGAFAIIYHYRKTPHNAVWSILPILIFCMWVKNSGMFFVLILSALTVVYCHKAHGHKKGFIAFVITFILPFAVFGAWLLRVKLVFPSGLESRHAFSVSAYISHLMSSNVTSDIIKAFISKLFHQEKVDIALYAVLFAMLAACMIWSFITRNAGLRKTILKAALWLALVYAVWLFALLAMYIFSMPTEQALQTAAFVRYNRGVLVPVILAALVLILEKICGEESASRRVMKPLLAAYILAAFAVLAIYPTVTRAYFFSGAKTAARTRAMNMIRDTKTECDLSYLIMLEPESKKNLDTQAAEVYNLYKYEFKTDDIDLIYKHNGDERYALYSVKRSGERYVPYKELITEPKEWLKEKMPEYDYVIILDKMPDLNEIARNVSDEIGAVLIDATAY